MEKERSEDIFVLRRRELRRHCRGGSSKETLLEK